MKGLYLLPVLTLFCCGQQNLPKQTQPEQVALMRTYKVPDGMGEMVVNALNNNLSMISKSEAPGRAELLPNGSVLLLGPPQIQEGMKDLLANLEGAPNLEVNTQMELWVLLVNRGKGEELPRDLAEALKTVEPAADQHYRVMERFTVQGATGQRIRVLGRFLRLEAELQKRGGQKRANVTVNFSQSILTSSIYLEDERYLMLGQSSFMLDQDMAQSMNMEPGVFPLRYVFRAIESQTTL